MYQNPLDAFLLSDNDDISLTNYVTTMTNHKQASAMQPQSLSALILQRNPLISPMPRFSDQESLASSREQKQPAQLLEIMDDMHEQTNMNVYLRELDREMALDVREERGNGTPRPERREASARMAQKQWMMDTDDNGNENGNGSSIISTTTTTTMNQNHEDIGGESNCSESLDHGADSMINSHKNTSDQPTNGDSSPTSVHTDSPSEHADDSQNDIDLPNTPESPAHQTSPQNKPNLKINLSIIKEAKGSHVDSVRSISTDAQSGRSTMRSSRPVFVVNFQSFHSGNQIMNLLLHLTKQKMSEHRRDFPKDDYIQEEYIVSGKSSEYLPQNLYSNLTHLVDSCTMPIKSFWTLRLFSFKKNDRTNRYAYNRACSYIDTFRWCFKNQHYFIFETDDGLPSVDDYREIKNMMRLGEDRPLSDGQLHFSDILKHELQYLLALDTSNMLQVQIYRHLRDNALPSSIQVDPEYMHADYYSIKGRSLVLDDDDPRQTISNLPQVPVPKILEPWCKLTDQKWNDCGVLLPRPSELHFSLEPPLPPSPAQEWRSLVGARDKNAIFFVLVRDVLMAQPENNILQKDTAFLGYVGLAEQGVEQYFSQRNIQQTFTHFVRCAKSAVYMPHVDEASEQTSLDLTLLLSWLQEPKNYFLPQCGTQASNCIIFVIDSASYTEEGRSEDVEEFFAPSMAASPVAQAARFQSKRQVRRFFQKRLDETKFELSLSDCNHGLNWKHFAAPDSAWVDKQTFTPRRADSPLTPLRRSPLTSTPTNKRSPSVRKSSPLTPVAQLKGAPQTGSTSPSSAGSVKESPTKRSFKFTEDTYSALTPRDYSVLLARKGEEDPSHLEKLYSYFCKEHGCKPNSAIVKQFRNGVICSENGVIDLSLNLVGDKGIRPIIDCAALMKKCRSFCARNNHLSNAAIQYLCKHMKKNTGIRHLDLRGNEDLGLFCGQELLQFVRECEWIQDVELERTSIPLRILDDIKEELQNRFKSEMSG